MNVIDSAFFINPRAYVAGMPFDIISKEAAEFAIKHREASEPFEYVVTPNVDHVVRNQKLNLQYLYDDAWLSVCDSRILQKLSPIVNVRFPDVITGSDLTRTIFEKFLQSGDAITIIGCDKIQINELRTRLNEITIHHYNPPMGFIKDAVEIERAVSFVLSHPARFIFLAVGSPQQEHLANSIKKSGATGTGLCIGASILFITGAEKRASKWIQNLHLEWLFRLLQNPKRLWRRYLIDNPAIFYLIFRQRFFLASEER